MFMKSVIRELLESLCGYGHQSLLSLVCSQVVVSAMGLSLLGRGPNECGVYLRVVLKSQLGLSCHAKHYLF